MAPTLREADGEPFALFDDDEGGAYLLTDLRPLPFDASADACQVLAQLTDVARQGCWLAVAADYALGGCFDPAAVVRTFPGRPLLKAWAFATARRLAHAAVDDFLAARLAMLDEEQCLAGIAELTSTLDQAAYSAQVRQIQRWIADGDCYQINLTFPLLFRVYGHPLALYAALRARQPVRYGGCLLDGQTTLLSFSPELFFERRGDRVHTRPMKGTARRGATPAEDARVCADLLASEKERAENVMIVDLLRNDLGRLARPGRVRVDALFEAEAYPTLWQLVSTVSADLPQVSLPALFGALFPCGSITGAPKLRAMQRIAELEQSPRGVYTGAFGWLAPSGDCRFNVAIRTLEFDTPTRARLGVGSGIVADAEPDREYAECLLKARFLSAYDPGFALIETMRLAAGVYPLLSGHLCRLERSARDLGFVCDLPRITTALQNEAAQHADGLHRVRLTLRHDGTHHLASEPWAAGEERNRRVILTGQTLSADNYLLRHKTTARGLFDHALSAIADRPQIIDVLFLNERGEVCQGARSNVFLERNGVLLTPPLSCGLLPGVFRQSLLDAGRAVEQVLLLDDLRRSEPLYIGNALRGLLPVVLDQ